MDGRRVWWSCKDWIWAEFWAHYKLNFYVLCSCPSLWVLHRAVRIVGVSVASGGAARTDASGVTGQIAKREDGP